MNELTSKDRAALRAKAHTLKPTVMIGRDNISGTLIQALEEHFAVHELVKIKVQKSSTISRDEAAARLSELTGAAQIQQIGRIIVLYRPLPEDDE